MVVVLVASSVTLYAQRDKNRDKTPPAHQSAPTRQAAPSHQSAPAQSRQAPHESRPAPQAATPHPSAPPSNPTPTYRGQGQSTHQGQGQITRQNSGQPTGQGTTYGGQGNRGNTGQGTGQGTPAGGQGNPGNTGQGMGQGTTYGGQGNRGNTGQGMGQGTTYGGQGNRGNTGQPNSDSGGRRFGSNGGGPGSPNVTHTRNGGDVYRSSNGSVREVHTPGGAVIHHAPDGGRRVEVARPGGRVVVASDRGRNGYVQRPLVINNRTYVQRTYIYNGASYARVYRPYSYGGSIFHVYTPYRYYHPSFYAYVYNPWARPVYYSWGWGGSPWYGYYGGWFSPYPVYSSPALWLTDYLIARTLEDAYQARAEAAASRQAQNYAATAMTADVKQAVADEVRRQLDQERSEQQNQNSAQAGGAPPLFSRNGPQVFVVSNSLMVNSPGGDCPVTEGDVLQMNGAPQQNASYADVVVLASKGQDCRKGSLVSVSLNDLQEMQNQMRATIDQGLGDLQSKQGQGGLPTLPPGAGAAPANAFGNAVQVDANVSAELSQAAMEADRAEQDVVKQSRDNQGAVPTISLGMTTSEVEQILGRPKDVANVGTKKIYVYQNMKVIFMDGRVSDVQ
jgi:hypothetical protein